MSQNLVKNIRLVQNSHKFLSKSLGCGKETLQREAGILTVPPSISGYRQEMDENISTAALIVGVSTAWLHLSFPPFPASILQSKAVQFKL